MPWPHCGNIGAKCLFREHNDPLLSSGTEPREESFAAANLFSYPLSCIGASWDNSVNYLSKDELATLLLLNGALTD